MIEVTKKHGQITVNGHAGFAPAQVGERIDAYD